MTTRIFTRLAMAFVPLVLLTACASASSQATDSEPPGRVVVGSTSEGDHAPIESTGNQMMSAEHAMDPDAGNISNAQNQQIP